MNKYIGKYMKCSCGDIFKVVSYYENIKVYRVYYMHETHHSTDVIKEHIENESIILTKDEVMLEEL